MTVAARSQIVTARSATHCVPDDRMVLQQKPSQPRHSPVPGLLLFYTRVARKSQQQRLKVGTFSLSLPKRCGKDELVEKTREFEHRDRDAAIGAATKWVFAFSQRATLYVKSILASERDGTWVATVTFRETS